MPSSPTTRVPRIVRKLGSLLPATRGRRRRRGQIVRPWHDDFARTHPTVGLTPSRVLSILHAADAGSPQTQFELFAEMLRKWPRLAAVEATRRLALTGLDWEIVPGQAGRTADGSSRERALHNRAARDEFDVTNEPGPDGGNADDSDATASASAPTHPRGKQADPDAQRAADHCRAALERIETFRDVLTHLAGAIGSGLAVAELVWENAVLVDVVPVPMSRLLSDPHEPWRLRIRTEEEPSLGVPLDAHPNKWIVHRPTPTPGRHFDSGLLRASVLLYVAQNLSFKDWLIYSQIAGMPVRVARFEPGTLEEDKQKLLKMLESLGTDAVAAFSKNVELQFVESSRAGDKPYQPLQDYCNNEITILWLGQHLTTDIRSQGSRAAAEIHDRVREDLLVDDIADEGQTIRRDLLRPLVQARFGDRVPVPAFRRSLVQSVDTKVLADTLSVAVRELGMRVPRRWVHQALGIPEPAGEEPVLTGGEA